MSSSLDTGLQIVGAAAAVVGTYFGYRQYRQARAAHQDEASPDAQSFTCKTYSNPVMIGVAVVVGVCGAYAFLVLSQSRGTETADRLLGLAIMLLSVFFFDVETTPHRVQLDERVFAVARSYRSPKTWQVPWDRIDRVAVITNLSGHRLVVAVMPEGSGYVPGIPQTRFSKQYGGYVMCELRETEPSEEAFLDALHRFSGEEVQC